jgi:hypothetical protein
MSISKSLSFPSNLKLLLKSGVGFSLGKWQKGGGSVTRVQNVDFPQSLPAENVDFPSPWLLLLSKFETLWLFFARLTSAGSGARERGEEIVGSARSQERLLNCLPATAPNFCLERSQCLQVPRVPWSCLLPGASPTWSPPTRPVSAFSPQLGQFLFMSTFHLQKNVLAPLNCCLLFVLFVLRSLYLLIPFLYFF